MFDINQSVSNEDGEQDEELTQKYLDGLMTEFVESAEAKAEPDPAEVGSWAAMMMEYAFSYIGCTPAEMTLRDFNEVVFEIFPRKVSVEADEAGAIIAELRAFWRFMARQYDLDNARAILATLDDRATARLREQLANPANFGMAKSFFMLGSQAGFDMTTPEGLAAFQTAYNAGLSNPALQPGLPPPSQYALPSGSNLPPPERPTSDELKKKRKEKKRQREAKKRNRRR
jgi:hypothetical protein